MDPISVLGLVGSCGSIIDLAAKSIKALSELHSRFQRADLSISLLISQLTTLKAALQQIERWISTELASETQHYQLIIDLDASLSACKLLTSFMDQHITKLAWDDDNKLEFESRVRVVLEDKATKDILTHLGSQTSALNLLITAFQW
jgi:hypothetical protein